MNQSQVSLSLPFSSLSLSPLRRSYPAHLRRSYPAHPNSLIIRTLRRLASKLRSLQASTFFCFSDFHGTLLLSQNFCVSFLLFCLRNPYSEVNLTLEWLLDVKILVSRIDPVRLYCFWCFLLDENFIETNFIGALLIGYCIVE